MNNNQFQPTNAIMIFNLDPSFTEYDIRSIFGGVGQICALSVFSVKGNVSKSVAINYKTQSEAEKAVREFDEAEIDGRPLRVLLLVSYIRPKTQQITDEDRNAQIKEQLDKDLEDYHTKGRRQYKFRHQESPNYISCELP